MKILKVLGKSLLSVGRLAPYLLTLLVLVLALRGIPGNPDVAKLNTSSWKDAGPFDTSPERGRFALVYSIMVRMFPFSLRDLPLYLFLGI